MKYNFFLLPLLILIIITACEGPMGPEGSPGPDDLPTSFEFEAELVSENSFEYCRNIPGQIEVFEADVILAYALEDYIEDDDLEVWRQIPITEFNDRGTLLFDFDYTLLDVCIFLDADYRLTNADEFDRVLIRAVHVPSVFLSQSQSVNIKNAETFRDLETMLGVDIQPDRKK